MKIKLCLAVVCVAVFRVNAQNVDSLRQVIQAMEFRVPEVSPLPRTVLHTRTPVVSLNGTWQFYPDSRKREKAFPIEVPGEWGMQGFTVPKGTAVVYRKNYTLPDSWKQNRVKIRFDGVSSYAAVTVNGIPVGTHEGSFAVFECDVTDAVRPGMNLLEVEVQCETISDILACTSQYAAHPVGGILRKVTLYTLPEVNISGFAWTVQFDRQYRDASLTISGRIALHGRAVKKAALKFTLNDAHGASVPLPKNIFNVPLDAASGEVNCRLTVAAPRHWDPEHPVLYVLSTSLVADGKVLQSNVEKIGFRQIELRGNQFFVNGTPVKLKGVNHHDVHPLRGRSLTPELCRKDVELFRAGNCNYLRTSHYPPSEELLQACDELGMFVESEASLCWIDHPASPVWKTWNYLDTLYLPHMLRANLDNVLSGRGHPCVIIWSLGNESRWSPLWERVNDEVKRLDPSRPTSFHDQSWGGFNNGHSKADVANYHYPGLNGPRECEKDTSRPTMFGEYMHVQTYARRELETDPSVRSDAYARTLKQMVDSVYAHPACMGGAIWSGVDDIFHLSHEQICGYGPWGVIDGWRREKPEYVGMKKSYSPVVLAHSGAVQPLNGVLELQVENRYNFFNLKELTITARIGGRVVPVLADVAPLSRGVLKVAVPNALPVPDVALSFYDPRGFYCEEEVVHCGKPEAATMLGASVVVTSAEQKNSIVITSGTNTFFIGKADGAFELITSGADTIVHRGAEMMLIPNNRDDGGAPGISSNNFTERIKPLDYPPLDSVHLISIGADKRSDGAVLVSAELRFGHQLAGGLHYEFAPDGSVRVSYDYTALVDYTAKASALLRQYGLLFSLPRSFDRLKWKRVGLWSVYPAYDPNRLEGEASAHPRYLNYEEEPRAVPSGPWKENANALGSNDFRGTKGNILWASLTNDRGRVVTIRSDGSQHARAWVDGNSIRFMAAGLNGPGSCFFFTGPRPELEKGSRLTGAFTLEIE